MWQLSMAISPGFIKRLARIWVAIAAATYALDMLRTKGTSLLDPAGRPLGDDFVNYWAGAFLAWHGRAAEVYQLAGLPRLPGIDRWRGPRFLPLQLSTNPADPDRAIRGAALFARPRHLADRELVRLLPGPEARDAGPRRPAARARDTRGVRERLWGTERHLDRRAFRRGALPDRAAPVRRGRAVRLDDLQAAPRPADSGRAARRSPVVGDCRCESPARARFSSPPS